MLIFLWFPNDVKASVSIDSSSSAIMRSIYFLKVKGCRNIPLPFSSRISFRTFYNFDLGFCQLYEIYLARWCEKFSINGDREMIPPKFVSISESKKYFCKNEATSFVPTFFLRLSKRKEIKKFFERVDLCFDFSLSLFYFEVALLTKDGPSFKFFHLPECKKAEDEEKRGRPFRFSDCIKHQYYWFLATCNGEMKKNKKGSADIESVEKYFAFLYWFASCFTFWFDVRICSYLFCCIKIPIKSVFELFFIFRYLFLRKQCDELSKKCIMEMNEEEKDRLDLLRDIKEEKRDLMLSACTEIFPFMLLTQSLEFSIRF